MSTPASRPHGAPHRLLAATDAARSAALIIGARVASRTGGAITLEVTDVLRSPSDLAPPIVDPEEPPLPLGVGDDVFLFLAGPGLGPVLYITASRTIAERLVAGLPPSEPMPSARQLQQI